MKPVFQTILTPPHGNCFQAAVASVLEMGLYEVPNFALRFDDEEWWIHDFVPFLRGRGLYPIQLALPQESGWLPSGYHLLTVPSPRGDYNHELVGLDGAPVHDPYPGGDLAEYGPPKHCTVFVSLMLRGLPHDKHSGL